MSAAALIEGRLPYATGGTSVDTAWRVVLTMRRAYNARLLTMRLRGAGLDYAVIADGECGEETLASGVTGAGVTRIALPEILGCYSIELQVRLTAPGSPVDALAEASWLPIGAGPTVP